MAPRTRYAAAPDGARIAYQSNRQTGPDILVISVDGGERARLTSNRDGDRVPTWAGAPSPPA